MKVGIVNYGMGNLASVYRALLTIGADPYVANHPAELKDAYRIILPGVGAFGEGMNRLDEAGWTGEIKRLAGSEGRPLLGICLGMQFLAERGTEGVARDGLGFIGGEVVNLKALGCADRIPHVGWNEVHIAGADPLLERIPEATDFYFVHSYGFRVSDAKCLLATVRYGCDVAAIVGKDNVWGTQFHPEKSSKAGLQLLRNFVGVSGGA
jgi:imidazole glycerol-phosphate synthase subunit HisH